MDAPGPDGDPPAPALVPPTFDQIDFNELTTHEALGEIWHRISAIMQYLIGKDQERDIKTDRLITNINNGFARVSREAKARDLNAKNRIRNSHVYGDNDQLYPLYNTSTGLPIPSLPTRKSELQGYGAPRVRIILQALGEDVPQGREYTVGQARKDLRVAMGLSES